MEDIKKFCDCNNLGNVISIKQLTGGLMHKMFKVQTNKTEYAIKVLNPEVISRTEAYDNFIISETIANLAKNNNIPVSCANIVNNNYLNEFNGKYYMVFDFVDGKILSDEEITVNHCIKIGNILSQIHSLNYESIGLQPEVEIYKKLYDWESYTNNINFNNMSYKNKYLSNYKKYSELQNKANINFNSSNTLLCICHRDMDPKNVMWCDDEPIVIDWESASLANPYRELLEDALCWSGFLSNNFDEEKFLSVITSYKKNTNIDNVDWKAVIYGNLVGRLGWLKYNLQRSLGIKTEDKEEMLLAEKEVLKTIDEINRYLSLSDTMYNILSELQNKKSNSK